MKAKIGICLDNLFSANLLNKVKVKLLFLSLYLSSLFELAVDKLQGLGHMGTSQDLPFT